MGQSRIVRVFKPDFLKSIVKLHLTSCNTEINENVLKSFKPVPVQIEKRKQQQKNIKIRWKIIQS